MDERLIIYETNETVRLTVEERVEEVRLLVVEKEGADGLSAYEIALQNGFVGTEAEWLESLKGEKGNTGNDSSISFISAFAGM